MRRTAQRTIFSLVIFLAAIVGAGGLPFAAAQAEQITPQWVTTATSAVDEEDCTDPTVTVNALSARPGDTVTAWGHNWMAGDFIRIHLVDGPVDLPLGTVDPVPVDGNWETSFTIPDEPHNYALIFAGEPELCAHEILFDFIVEEPAPPLEANAGPDQTFTLPIENPAEVWFHGCDSTGDIVDRIQWFNQWGELRSEKACDPKFMVNFGENPQPGTTRSFQLVVTDSGGNKDNDWVTLTLEEGTIQGDPGKGAEFTGNEYFYYDDSTDSKQRVRLGLLNLEGKPRWYLSVSPSAGVECQDYIWGELQGTHWQTDNAEGCLGPEDNNPYNADGGPCEACIALSLDVDSEENEKVVYMVLGRTGENKEDHQIATIKAIEGMKFQGLDVVFEEKRY